MTNALVRRSPTAGPLPEYVRRDEARAALARLEGPALTQKRAHAFVRALWELGPRVTELLGLRVGDIDWMLRTVRLTTLKQKAPKDETKRRRWRPPQRVIPVKAELLEELAAYLTAAELKEPAARVWTWSRRFGHSVCSRALRAVGVEPVRANPRAMRHGFAVNCAFQGIPLPVVQQWMGHADAATTSIYMQIIARDAHPWLEKVDF